jgi:hypothetical protein
MSISLAFSISSALFWIFTWSDCYFKKFSPILDYLAANVKTRGLSKE